MKDLSRAAGSAATPAPGPLPKKKGAASGHVEIKAMVSPLNGKKPQDSSLQGKFKRCFVWVCAKIALSPYFSFITTILTFYALFGDDMRLIFTDREADFAFDCVTVVCMTVFAMEIVVNSFGKAGYLLGFFFHLDILSTVTLVLDITVVAEACFGDSISQNADAQKSSGGGESDSDSAEAARAARMSRAGTKAGRVVRLIRLMRLIRLVKLFKKKGDEKPKYDSPLPGAGDEWDDDDVQVPVNESAVSKKLSEMTTRRVIMLVLSILLILPFFQADMYKDALSTSAQYGIDSLYRRFREDMLAFDPSASPEARKYYLNSTARENYVNDFLLYTYFHNWFCDGVPEDKAVSPETSFGKLFWVGGSPIDAPEADFFLPGNNETKKGTDWNQQWNGDAWALYLCNLPAKAQAALSTPWRQAGKCLGDRIRGISIIESKDTRVKCPRNLRFQERIIVSPMVMSKEESAKFVFMFIFDRRAGSKLEAALNSGQTIFICGLLGCGSMMFAKDANKLVLAPIERMITKLDKIRANPIAAMSIGEEEANKEQMEAYRRNEQDPGASDELGTRRLSLMGRILEKLKCGKGEPSAAPEPMETVVLEKTIVKIGSLLALGFGEAGAEIIGQNMRGNDSAALNAMIPGKRVEAIFGYCDIRNFSDATEVLEDQVMVFVNRVAGVVHSCINEFFGSPNQNVGDAFLLVWRLSGQEDCKQQRLADCATMSFMKIIALINKSPLLAEYRNHPKLTKRLPGFRVKMGFGLHTGWAIEGAIGSEFKIDASYLSPNVNMASRLQGFTKVYGNPLMISEALIRLVTDPISKLCRQIDRVAFSNTLGDSFELFTMDLDDLALKVEKESGPLSKSQKFKEKMDRQRRKAERWSDDFDMGQFVKQDEDIKLMRKRYSQEFFTKFKKALLCYENGNWSDAVPLLEELRFYNAGEEDGPTCAILQYMEGHFNEPPPRWAGYCVYLGTDYL